MKKHPLLTSLVVTILALGAVISLFCPSFTKAMKAQVAEKADLTIYHVSDVFPIEPNLHVIRAPKEPQMENMPYKIKAYSPWEITVIYDAESEGDMWIRGTTLHLVPGYRIGNE